MRSLDQATAVLDLDIAGMLRVPMRYLEIPLDVLRKAAARLSRAASMIRGASP
jgi:hypothetical protein